MESAPSVWLRGTKNELEYLALYVDDVCVWSKDPNAVLKTLQERFAMKGCGAPEYFLGMKISPTPDDGSWHQAGVHTRLSAETYIHNSLQKLVSTPSRPLRY